MYFTFFTSLVLYLLSLAFWNLVRLRHLSFLHLGKDVFPHFFFFYIGTIGNEKGDLDGSMVSMLITLYISASTPACFVIGMGYGVTLTGVLCFNLNLHSYPIIFPGVSLNTSGYSFSNPLRNWIGYFSCLSSNGIVAVSLVPCIVAS